MRVGTPVIVATALAVGGSLANQAIVAKGEWLRSGSSSIPYGYRIPSIEIGMQIEILKRRVVSLSLCKLDRFED